MDELRIKYRTTGKALPPQPIRMKIPGWGGSPDIRMEDGSEPQPWHCPPFVDGSTYGLELLYPYETECHVLNVDGDIRFEWDFAREPGIKLSGEEFGAFFPRPASFYLFQTGLDLQAPPGHVLRMQPHPRFYTDQTGTVPPAVIGHIQTQWWPKTFFAVFKVPPPGQRHIFRNGDPYAQVLFVPQAGSYEAVRMTPEEEAARAQLEETVIIAGAYIARNPWFNPAGHLFMDHYKVLERAFKREGSDGVQQVADQALQRLKDVVPQGKTIPQCLELAHQYQREGKYVEARTIYLFVLHQDPGNAEALSRFAILSNSLQATQFAVELMMRAVAAQPQSPVYHANLGNLLQKLGRHAEAEASFRRALRLNPGNPQLIGNLAMTLAEQDRVDEALQACRAALAISQTPMLHYQLGEILSRGGQHADARAAYEAALAIDPNFKPALQRVASDQSQSPETAAGPQPS